MASLVTPTDPRRVSALKDALRQTFVGGRVMLTTGVAGLPVVTRAAVLTAVRSFEAFEAGNDLYAEHDFGAISVSGVRVFWKIDAYDQALAGASPDPADPSVTVRVLTIMLAEEW